MKYLTSLKLAICNHIKGSGYSYRYKRNLSRLLTSFFVLVLLLMFKAQTLPTLQEYFFRASQQYPEGRSKSSSGLTNSQKKLREMLVLMEVERTTPIGSTAIATSLSTKSARRGTVSAEATARQQARTRNSERRWREFIMACVGQWVRRRRAFALFRVNHNRSRFHGFFRVITATSRRKPRRNVKHTKHSPRLVS